MDTSVTGKQNQLPEVRQGIPSHIVLQHTRTVVRQGKREVRMSEMQEEDYEYVGRHAYEDAPTEGKARGGGRYTHRVIHTISVLS